LYTFFYTFTILSIYRKSLYREFGFRPYIFDRNYRIKNVPAIRKVLAILAFQLAGEVCSEAARGPSQLRWQTFDEAEVRLEFVAI